MFFIVKCKNYSWKPLNIANQIANIKTTNLWMLCALFERDNLERVSFVVELGFHASARMVIEHVEKGNEVVKIRTRRFYAGRGERHVSVVVRVHTPVWIISVHKMFFQRCSKIKSSNRNMIFLKLNKILTPVCINSTSIICYK